MLGKEKSLPFLKVSDNVIYIALLSNNALCNFLENASSDPRGTESSSGIGGFACGFTGWAVYRWRSGSRWNWSVRQAAC